MVRQDATLVCLFVVKSWIIDGDVRAWRNSALNTNHSHSPCLLIALKVGLSNILSCGEVMKLLLPREGISPYIHIAYVRTVKSAIHTMCQRDNLLSMICMF